MQGPPNQGELINVMPQTLRKLIGVVLLIVLVTVYAILAVTIASARLAESSAWVHLAYFAVSGVVWILPAMGIIKWMEKPNKKRS